MAIPKPFRINLRMKLMGALLALSISPILLTSYFTFLGSANFLKGTILRSLEGIADLKAQAIESFVRDRILELKSLAAIPEVVSYTAQLMKETAPPPEETQPAEKPQPAPEKSPAPGGKAGSLIQQDIPTAPAEQSPGGSAAAGQPPVPEQGKTAEQKKAEETPAYQALNKTLALVLSPGEKYEELFLLDPQGTVQVSTFYNHEGKSAAQNEYVAKGQTATFIQDTSVSGLTGSLSMVIATPVKNEIGKTIGILAARLNLKTLQKIVKTEKGVGETGETVVGKKIGQEVVLMAPTRYDEEAALKRKIPVGSGKETPLQQAAREREGSGLSVDYRGVQVLAAWRHIPTLNWGLATKMDAKEALKPIAVERNLVLGIALVLIGLAVWLSVKISRGIVGPLRELTEAAEAVSKGNLQVKLTIRSKDEVGDLATSFERMVAAIRFLKEPEEKPEKGQG